MASTSHLAAITPLLHSTASVPASRTVQVVPGGGTGGGTKALRPHLISGACLFPPSSFTRTVGSTTIAQLSCPISPPNGLELFDFDASRSTPNDFSSPESLQDALCEATSNCYSLKDTCLGKHNSVPSTRSVSSTHSSLSTRAVSSTHSSLSTHSALSAHSTP